MKPEKMGSEEVVRALAETVAEMLGQNVRILDLRGLSDIADWFIVASVKSKRHLKILGRDLIGEIEAADVGKPKVEGLDGDSWVIIDLFDIVVHLFMPEKREFYALESYWGDAAVEVIDIDGAEEAEGD